MINTEEIAPYTDAKALYDIPGTNQYWINTEEIPPDTTAKTVYDIPSAKQHRIKTRDCSKYGC